MFIALGSINYLFITKAMKLYETYKISQLLLKIHKRKIELEQLTFSIIPAFNFT